MFITNGKEKLPWEEANSIQQGDILNSELINSLGHIVVVDRLNSKYDVESMCVQTGIVRFFVCGLIQAGSICDFYYAVGDNGIKIDIDELFLD